MSEPDRKPACIVCRQRKVACDRRRPRCGLCAKSGFECGYTPRDHRPGLRAGYVAQLEKRLDTLEKRMDEVVSRLSPEPSEVPVSNGAPLLGDQPMDQAIESRSHFNGTPLDVSLDNSHETESSSPRWLEGLEFELRTVWLQQYQSWFPILHHTSVSNVLLDDRPEQRLVAKAIMAVNVLDVGGMPWEQRLAWSQKIREEVILECLASTTLRSVQALLTLSMLFWGEGKWSEYGNLIAMCRRMSQQLEVPTGAGRLSYSLGSTETFAINPDIDYEERLRTCWMIEILDSVFALNVGSHVSSSSAPPARLPCSDGSWASQVSGEAGTRIENLEFSSGFAMCIHLCTVELEAVHRFQQASRESNSTPGNPDWQTTAQRLDERLTIWREEFVAAVFRLINAVSHEDSRGEMEPFIVLTNCLLNMGVISLLQSQSSLPQGVQTDLDSWPYANHRCMYACENMAAKIRRMEEDKLRYCSPLLVLAIFVAARFYIVHTKCLQADVSVNLHSLAYSLHICSHRWPLAKMFEAVIRTAVAEHRTPVLESALPVEFYDLRHQVIDICPLLQRWMENSWVPVPGAI